MEIGTQISDKEVVKTLSMDRIPDAVIKFLYRSNYRKVSSYINQNSGSDEDAEDVFQEALITLIDLVRQGKFREESSVSTFLLAVVRNIWLNELKKRNRSQLRDEKFEKGKSTVDEDISKHIVNREMRSQLMLLVQGLGEMCKKILLAYYYDNLSMKEILQQLDYENEQVVRNKKYKCLKQLEQSLIAKPGVARNLKTIFSYE
ncbi:MAG: sigma-70 family RNA polymerase sigma factor [Bacteroidota bacterium]|nr:sigma-70 family RNA polymerase sigma factor [Bacteroidota bacterium]